jgi:hypothetical protein
MPWSSPSVSAAVC